MPLQKKPPTILLVGDLVNQGIPAPVPAQLIDQLNKFPVQFVTTTDVYSRTDVDGLILVGRNMSVLDHQAFQHWIQTPFPVLFIFENMNRVPMTDVFNKFPWVQFVMVEEQSGNRDKAIGDFVRGVILRQEDMRWGQELRHRAKELDDLSKAFEETVTAETGGLENSVQQEKIFLDFNSKIVLYLQALLKTRGPEEAFQVFERAIHPLKIWSGSYLLLQVEGMETLYYQGKVKKSQVPVDKVLEATDIANRIGKPLVAPTIEKFELGESMLGYIVLESFSTKPAIPEVLKLTNHYKELLVSVLRTWALGEDIENTVHLWEVAFDEMTEPIALIQEDFHLLRANHGFVRNTKWSKPKCYEVFASRSAPCPGCPIVEMKSQSELSLSSEVWSVSSSSVGNSGKQKLFIHQYKDRTQELKLTQKWIQSEKLSALGQLAKHVANELNNPIGGIKNQTQILLAELDPNTSTYQDLVEVEKAATRSLKIISHLLDFSQGRTASENISVRSAVDAVLSFLKTSIRGHKVEVLIPESDIVLNGNVQLFQQVLFNVANNAVQAMDKPGLLKIEAQVGDNNILIVKVTDTGSGIPLHLQQKIFEPFFTTKESGQGTGLGLALVADILEQMKGRIYFHSQPEVGTTFFIEVPIGVGGPR